MQATSDENREPVRDPGHRDYHRFWMALHRRDVPAADAIVDRWLQRWPAQRLYLRLFEPALKLSGTLFARGRINYRDEHFVTWHTLQFLRRVRRHFVRPSPTGPLALAMSVAQESHVIGLRMVCDFLQHDNWRIAWAPSNDRAAMRDALHQLAPDALLMSIGLDRGLAPARRLVEDVRRHGFAGLVIAGGRAINRDAALLTYLGADLTASNGLELLRALRGRLTWDRGGDRSRDRASVLDHTQ